MGRRSGEAQAAQRRRAGPMKHRNTPRGGARNERADLLDEDLEEEPDLGSLICPTTHQNRVHPLGGGMFVCFECLAKLV